MKNLLVFTVMALSACTQYSPSKYPVVTPADMDIIATKMRNKILPGTSSDGFTYFTNLPDNVLSGPALSFSMSKRYGSVFRIDVTTTKGSVTMDINSDGKIIRAWGYSKPSIESYYSQVWPEKSVASPEAVDFYIWLQRAVVSYIKSYGKKI